MEIKYLEKQYEGYDIGQTPTPDYTITDISSLEPNPSNGDITLCNIDGGWAWNGTSTNPLGSKVTLLRVGEYIRFDGTDWVIINYSMEYTPGDSMIAVNKSYIEITPDLRVPYLILSKHSSNPVPIGNNGIWVDNDDILKFTDTSGTVYTITMS